MAILPVNQLFDRPNIAGNFLAGQQLGQQNRRQRQAEDQQNEFRNLTTNALAGDLSAFERQVALNPGQAMQVQQAGDITANKVRGAAKYMMEAIKQGDPAAIQGRYNAVRPMLERAGREQGKVPPPNWSPEMLPMIEQALAQTAYLESGGQGQRVQSRFVAEDGTVWALMADGQRQQLTDEQGAPIKADRQMWLRDNPGQPPHLVGKDATVTYVGQQQPGGQQQMPAQAQQPAGPQITQFVGPDGLPVAIGNDIPEHVRQAILVNPGGWQEAPSGATAQIGAQPSPAGGQMPQGMPPGPQAAATAPQQGGQLPPPLSYQGGGLARPSEAQTAAEVEAARQRAQLQYLPYQQQIETQGAIERERGVGQVKQELERGQEAPKRVARYEQALATAANVGTSINRAMEMIGPTTTGFIGARLRGVEGTPAYNLAAEIETIKANLGFDRLQQMRDNSPTGGALGQVAIQELIALQSTVANLDPNQSDEQLRQNLQRIQEHYNLWQFTVQQALADERAGGGQQGGGQGQSASGGVDDLLSKYGVR